MDITNEKKEVNVKKNFQYKLKIRTAIIGFILYLLLSTKTSFKILHLILASTISFHQEQKDEGNSSFIDKLIMAFIIAIILFIF